MEASTRSDADILRTTTHLIDFLQELTSESGRERVRDITSNSKQSPDPVLWLAELPEGVSLGSTGGETLLEIEPVAARTAAPQPPSILLGWLDPEEVGSPTGSEPALAPSGPLDVVVVGSDGQRVIETRDVRSTEAGDVSKAYHQWLRTWQEWSAQERIRGRHRQFYESLEHVMKVLEQQDDEYEFVLATGLVTWRAPGGTVMRRHVVTTPVRTMVAPRTARISVVQETDRPLRLEDRELFEGEDVYWPKRGQERREAIQHGEPDLLAAGFFDSLRSWFAVIVDAVIDVRDGWQRPTDEPTATVRLTATPALLLRPRSQAALAETYRRIAAALREPDAKIPIGLANLVADVDRTRRDRWLAEQGAAGGDVLGEDPLFPLPANEEQSRILERLRTETGVVVQGPPGTGKTHTIANLICALLARGQRVLVTSEKEQALRVLRTKVPDELRALCVLLAGTSRGGSEELQRGIEALSGLVATTDADALEDRARRLASERDARRQRGAELTEQIRALREAEIYRHPPVVPGYGNDVYRGTLVEIVRDVVEGANRNNWMPMLPEGVPDRPPLAAGEFAELRALLRDHTPALQARAGQRIPEPKELPTVSEYAALVEAESDAQEATGAASSPAARLLATLSGDRLMSLEALSDRAHNVLHAMDLPEETESWSKTDWRVRAIEDLLAARNAGLWQGYLEDPPSPYGPVPRLEDVREDEPHPAFESVLERRVFLELRSRGYQVVPRYRVGDYQIDLVVSGGNGRIAVECDGHYWHTDPDDQRRDLARQQKLQRAGWEMLRVRESEFELDRGRALGPVWERLEQRGITPSTATPGADGSTTSWRPMMIEEG